ncbi:MAG: M23 family metallopeptidase [Clostridia bacterium]|nr:M23 family metallopeptidase [Clostridia bacterium]MBO5024459.1 M23 family metallopeptidase [Clostridia bacterium]
MNMNQKKQKLNKGIGVAVAILLALTLFVTIIAFSVGKRTKDPVSTTGSTSTTKTSSTTQATTNTTQGTTEDPSTQTGIEELSFVCPVSGTLIKDYSADIPVFSLTMEDYRVHCGIDISADAGANVLAAASGTISKVEFDPLMGQTVQITHNGGYVTTYRNLQTKMPEGIEVGASVDAGDVIGYVGDTALIEISDSPHLHLEMTKDDKNINPLSLIKFESVDSSTDYED